MLLAYIAEISQQVAATSSRLYKIESLAECLRQFQSENEAFVGTAYLSGELPQGRIGLSEALLRVAVMAPPAAAATLTLTDVDQIFKQITQEVGTGARGRRSQLLHSLFARATLTEKDFLGRLINGNLRQGALQGIMVEALSHAADVPVADLRRAVMMAGDIKKVAAALFTSGKEGLLKFSIQVFQPVKPMLAQAADSINNAIKVLGTANLEYKIDGVRVQVHRRNNEVRIYSRNLNDVTAAVPELVELMLTLPHGDFILDGEAIALDSQGNPLPFQITMRRFGRKATDLSTREQWPLSVFFF